jgi:type II secretory pathway pseudopilin PulG
MMVSICESCIESYLVDTNLIEEHSDHAWKPVMFSEVRRSLAVLRSGTAKAFTLAEVMVAAGVLGLLLAAVGAAGGSILGLLSAQKQTVAASQAIEERVEQLRGVTYSKLTTPAYLQNSVFNTDTVSQATLPNLVETLTINAYPTAAATSIQITRQSGSATLGANPNATLGGSSMIRADLQLQWQKRGGGTHIRCVSIILAKGGINN